MDALDIAVFAGLAILLAIATSIALSRGRRLQDIDRLTASADPADPAAEPATRIRHLLERVSVAEEALAQQVRTATQVADTMGVGVVNLDDDLLITSANAAADAMLAVAPGSLVGRTAIGAFVDRRLEDVVVAARDSGSGAGEFRLRHADGPVVIVRARRAPAGGLLVVLEDVSELRRLQQIRAEFIDNLSHELRTPLSTVSLLAETLSRDAEAAGPAVPAKMRDRIAKIEVETGHLAQMINELLDLARIEGGGSLVMLDDVDLGRSAVESVERLRLFAERQGVTLTVDSPVDVPPVRGDQDRLGQVLINLVHNAVKFSSAGTQVTVRVRPGDGDVTVSVEDHGVGIPKAAQARIFERFYKVDRARVRGGGTGLGLSIARHAIEQHGGRIWVESEENVGSTFSFSLPVVTSVEAGASPASSPPPASSNSAA